MEYIISYGKTLIFFLLFMTFIKMLLNDKNYMKYIEVVLGFLLIIILIEPITKVLSIENIDFTIWEEKEIDIDEYTDLGENYAISLSEKTIESQIEDLLKDLNYEILDTTISFDEEYNLKSINIILRDKSISKINVDISVEGEGAIVESLEVLEIKNRLKDFYDLSLSHINVYIQ